MTPGTRTAIHLLDLAIERGDVEPTPEGLAELSGDKAWWLRRHLDAARALGLVQLDDNGRYAITADGREWVRGEDQ